MRCRSSLPFVLLLAVRLAAQGPPPAPVDPAGPIFPGSECPGTGPTLDWAGCEDGCGRERLASNRHFPNFIGFISNPLQNIDPRSLTQVVPIFGASWVVTTRALPDLDAQLYGPAISLAL